MMSNNTGFSEAPDVLALAERLAHARRQGSVVDVQGGLPLPLPGDEAAAYAVQHAILKINGSNIGGWKVGAKSPDGPIATSPLPAEGIFEAGATVARARLWPCALELEVAFKMGTVLQARAQPYTESEVFDALALMGTTVELVSSRYPAWPNMDKWAMLADLQSHGGLVCGEFVPYREDFPFTAPDVRFSLAGTDMVKPEANGKGSNPAGDPRRLLTWLVNYIATGLHIDVTPDMVLTTGTYTGIYRAESAGTVSAEIVGLPPFELTLT